MQILFLLGIDYLSTALDIYWVYHLVITKFGIACPSDIFKGLKIDIQVSGNTAITETINPVGERTTFKVVIAMSHLVMCTYSGCGM